MKDDNLELIQEKDKKEKVAVQKMPVTIKLNLATEFGQVHMRQEHLSNAVK